MDKRTRHATKHAKASIKEAIGMLIGNARVQAEGAAEKANAQQAVNNAGVLDPKIPPQA
ncbi:CsbD family protein [Sphingomonas prati]|uniref:Uncharacterized protein YjbJ (UPF0337 family) n=1 Tax=Sphingomonas prati TaxID=1843237 RepID=A0A7W9BWB0_9SPHN|nr:CsbD family protein [Sphingomonas prati]MBB5730838.1 uncharacterized protein YjbJ (UPF0337 family) [Sphingomonas prati]GGE97350.1 hypothetical protein GCM10011404_33140 [Sphingomonas prati]